MKANLSLISVSTILSITMTCSFATGQGDRNPNLAVYDAMKHLKTLLLSKDMPGYPKEIGNPGSEGGRSYFHLLQGITQSGDKCNLVIDEFDDVHGAPYAMLHWGMGPNRVADGFINLSASTKGYELLTLINSSSSILAAYHELDYGLYRLANISVQNIGQSKIRVTIQNEESPNGYPTEFKESGDTCVF